MTLVEQLSGASTVTDLRQSLQQGRKLWRAQQVHYLLYDDGHQQLEHPQVQVPLTKETQPGQAALTLRPCCDQSLSWPEPLQGDWAYRMSLPVMHWGNLHSVLLLGFSEEPDRPTRETIDRTIPVLGVLGYAIAERERTAEFVQRSQELLVHAVEARGLEGHVGRCSRVATALAQMLDCSAQARAELLLAAQYHDVGLLTFRDPSSPQAQREHAPRGARLLACHPDFAGVAPLVEFHHERYDGSGPLGKRHEEVPLEAWVMAVTEDLVESYEKASGSFADRIRAFFYESAKHHHPDVIDALCGLVDAEKLQSLLEG